MNSQVADTEKTRGDGRSFEQLRKLSLKCGELSRPDGSCRFELQGTSVIASVYGPMMELMPHKELAERARVEVVLLHENQAESTRTGGEENKARYVTGESILTGLFEQVIETTAFPRKLIKITLQVVVDDGSMLVCAVLAACGALMDAGIEMKAIPSASCCVVQQEDPAVVLIDPTKHEEESPSTLATVFVATTSDGGDPITINANGNIGRNTLRTCLGMCASAASSSRSFIQLSFLESVKARMLQE